MAASVSTSASAAMRSRSRSAVRYEAIMTAASVRTGTPAGQAWRSRARSSSRKVMRGTIATATDPNRAASASVRLSATVPVPADSCRAAACGSIRSMRSSTNSARKASKSSKCRCRTPLAQPASVVTARLVSALGPSRSRTRSAASNSCSRTSRMATPVGTAHPSSLAGPRPFDEWAYAHYGGRMPTIPPERARLSEQEPHQRRQVAESFGSDPERYDRARARYPQAMVERIVAASPEPDARMADFARQTGVEVEVATFEAWDSAGQAFDAVVAGQTWHWVDPVAGAATAAQVLRPGGQRAVFWNGDQPPPELAEAFAAVYRRVVPDSPFNIQPTGPTLDAYQAMFTKAADGIREVGGFSDPEQWRFGWEQSYTRDEWLDLLPTSGALTRLPAANLEEVLEGVGAAIDAMGGSFTMPYTTVTVTAARTSAA